MRVALFFLFVAATSVFEVSEVQAVFCYDEESCNQESSQWPGVCQSGQNQSPINLPSGPAIRLRYAMSMKQLETHQLSYDPANYASSSFSISDNGHSIQITLGPTKAPPAITGYQLSEPYILGQLHFHWGSLVSPNSGSEHEVDGVRRPMEVHLVHYKQSLGSVANAAAKGDSDGLAVIGTFLQVGSIMQESKAMKPILQNFQEKYNPNGTVVNQPIDVSEFLPRAGEYVWRYNGSLTTPGCNEIVRWTVLEPSRPISAVDYVKFQKVKGEEDEPLRHNNRKIQKLGSRNIEFFKVSK
jgi:carbonic anhydrase